ncbi:MAG: metal-dependent hydrolase [Candidatus Hodarchaeales archaeon]
MPFTPFHFGISICIYALLPLFDPLALLIGSVIPDIEGITAMFILPDLGLPLHGPLHSFTGAIILGVITGLLSFLLLNTGVNLFKDRIEYTPRLKISLVSALVGTISHILLDAPLYPEMDLLYPVSGNVLHGIVPSPVPFLICIIGFFIGFSVLMIRFVRKSYHR